MRSSSKGEFRNRLLSLFSDDDFSLLKSGLVLVDLPRRFVLAEEDRPFNHVYFLEAGIGSVMTRLPGGVVEAGIFGRDGVAPIGAILGMDQVPQEHFIQVAGFGYRIAIADFQQAVEASGSLRQLLSRYIQTFLMQVSVTALSNAVHHVDERLARWLLMCHDRSESDDLALTHDFIARMLAVRRASVTTALHVLEGRGFIQLDRGYIMVSNRVGLESFARDAYGRPEAEYFRLLGSMN